MQTTSDNINSIRAMGVNRSYAWQICHGKRAPSQKLAIRIFRETGLRMGPVADLTDAQIDVLAQIHGVE
jgi:hypothetical protein